MGYKFTDVDAEKIVPCWENKIPNAKPEGKAYSFSDQNGEILCAFSDRENKIPNHVQARGKSIPYFRPKWKHLYPFSDRNHLKPYVACLAESRKSNSAPVTPATSIPASLEDLRQRRRFAKSTDILKLSLSSAEYLSQLKQMRDNSSVQELEVKGEREGKFKGALRAMKRYVCIAFFHGCLGDDLTSQRI